MKSCEDCKHCRGFHISDGLGGPVKDGVDDVVCGRNKNNKHGLRKCKDINPNNNCENWDSGKKQHYVEMI